MTFTCVAFSIIKEARTSKVLAHGVEELKEN